MLIAQSKEETVWKLNDVHSQVNSRKLFHMKECKLLSWLLSKCIFGFLRFYTRSQSDACQTFLDSSLRKSYEKKFLAHFARYKMEMSVKKIVNKGTFAFMKLLLLLISLDTQCDEKFMIEAFRRPNNGIRKFHTKFEFHCWVIIRFRIFFLYSVYEWLVEKKSSRFSPRRNEAKAFFTRIQIEL